MTEKIVTKVAGFFKYPEGKPVMKALKHGDILILEREPTNPYDPNAIKISVKTRDGMIDRPNEEALTNNPPVFIQIGYVSAPIAAKIKNATIVKCEKTGPKWDEITIEVDGLDAA